jgi:hypothetical protein
MPKAAQRRRSRIFSGVRTRFSYNFAANEAQSHERNDGECRPCDEESRVCHAPIGEQRPMKDSGQHHHRVKQEETGEDRNHEGQETSAGGLIGDPVHL